MAFKTREFVVADEEGNIIGDVEVHEEILSDSKAEAIANLIGKRVAIDLLGIDPEVAERVYKQTQPLPDLT
jgi:hypothetical protein